MEELSKSSLQCISGGYPLSLGNGHRRPSLDGGSVQKNDSIVLPVSNQDNSTSIINLGDIKT